MVVECDLRRPAFSRLLRQRGAPLGLADCLRGKAQPLEVVRREAHTGLDLIEAGRVGTDVALRCVALCGSLGYGEGELLEKWARDVKILDIFEGTQQIQLLIIARQLLGKSSAELR